MGPTNLLASTEVKQSMKTKRLS